MKKIASIGMSVALMVSLVGCSQSASNNKAGENKSTEQKSNNAEAPKANAQPVVLKLGHGTSKESLYHAGSEKFKQLVEAKSNGKIKVDIYADGTIGQDKELINGMKGGTIQMGMIGVEPVMTDIAKLKVLGLPYIFTDRETAYKVLDGDLGKEMVADLPSKQGMRVLGYFENGFRQITNSKHPIEKPADVKGLKIRTPQNPVSLSIFKALGANPTPMSFGELFQALEQKTVDGQENPLANIYANKLHEVQKYAAITNHMYSPMLLTISEKTWSTLSSDLQKAIQDASTEARDYERKLSADQEADYAKKLEQAGVIISKPDLAAFKEATKDVHLEYDKEYGADFYQKVMDATKK